MRRSLSLLVMLAAIASCLPMARARESTAPVQTDAIAMDSAGRTVRDFVAAYNAHDVPAMLALADSSITWLTIMDDSVGVETRGHAELEASLGAYFRRLPTARSTLESLTATGPWVTVRERAHWQGRNGPRSQAAVAVYEVRANRVRRVWYFPAVP